MARSWTDRTVTVHSNVNVGTQERASSCVQETCGYACVLDEIRGLGVPGPMEVTLWMPMRFCMFKVT
jgi:hypothetical protein